MRWLLAVVLVAAGITVVDLPAARPAAAADVRPAAGQYVPLTPARIYTARPAPVNGATDIAPLGKGGVPTSGVSAVRLTLTVLGKNAGFLIAYPTGTARQGQSHLNYAADVKVSNSVVMAPGTGGTITIHNDSENTAAIDVDVVGYYRAAGATVAGDTFVPLQPARIQTDTVTAGAALPVAPLGKGGIPTANVSTVVAHVSLSTSATGANTVTVYPDGVTKPGTTDLAFTGPGHYTSFVAARLGANGTFRVHTTAAGTVTVDIVGYYQTPAGTAAGSSFVPLAPARVVAGEIIPADDSAEYLLAGKAGVPTSGVAAVAFNLTADDQGAVGALSTWAAGQPVPVARQLSYRVGVHSATLQVSRLGADGRIVVRNVGRSPVRILLDVAGYYRAATVPAAPTAVTATADNAAADVSWTPGSDGGAAVTGYRVTAAPGGATVVVTGPTARLAGLTNGVPHTFTVQAVNAVGASPSSAPSNAVTPAPPAPPGQPFVTDVTTRDGAVAVYWSPPPSGAGSVTGYLVRATSAGSASASVQVAGDRTDAVVPGLVNGAAYRVTVSAINGNGTGAASEPSRDVVPQPGQAPLRPTMTAVIALNQRVDLEWVAPTDGGADITGYTVTVSPGNRVVTVAAGTTVASITGLANGSTTTFAVAAVNRAGTGPAATVTAVPVASRPPAAPDDVSASATANGALTVTWKPPADTGTGPVTGYTVTASPGGASVTAGATATTAVLTGLNTTTAYTVTVRATSAAGAGAASPPSTPTTPKATVKNAPVLLSTASVAALRAVRGNGVLEFESPPAQVTGLTVGKLVLMAPGPLAPRGFFGRVTRVENRSGVFVVSTVQAGMDDAYTDADLAYTGAFSADEVEEFTPLSPGVRLATPTVGGAAALAAPNLGFRGGALVLEWQTELASDARGVGAKFEVQADFRPIFHAAAKVGLSGVNADFTVGGKEQVQIQTKAAFVHTFKKTWQLGEFRMRCFPVPTVAAPLYLCPQFTAELTLTINAAGGFAVQVEFSRSVDVGMSVDNTEVDFHGNVNVPDGIPAPTVEIFASVNVEVDLPLALEVYMYGVIGPRVVLTVYAQAFADTTQNPWWEIRVGIRAAAAVAVDFLGKELVWQSPPLVNLFVTVAKADGPFRGLRVTPPDPRTGVNVPLQLGVSALGAPLDVPVRWRVVKGPGSVDEFGVYRSPSMGAAEIEATALGNSVELSKGVTSVLVGPGPPDPPRFVNTAPAEFAATVAWQPPAADNGTPVTGYVVTTMPPTPVMRVPATATGTRIRGLVAGTVYRVQVQAVNAAGTSVPATSQGPVRATDDSFIQVGGDATLIADDAGIRPNDGVQPQLSRTGRYVVFTLSGQSPLAPVEIAGTFGKYLVRRDLVTGEIVLVSRDVDGVTPLTSGNTGAIDATGNIVAYANTDKGVFVHNLSTGVVTRMGADPALGSAGVLKLSADGSALAAMHWVPAELGTPIRHAVSWGRVFDGTLTRINRCWPVSICSAGVDGHVLSITGNGRQVLFQEQPPGSTDARQANLVYEGAPDTLTELYTEQQTPNQRVEVTVLSADGSTVGGRSTWFGVNPTLAGPFVQRSYTDTVDAVDRIALGTLGTQEISDDGRVALVLADDVVTTGVWTGIGVTPVPGQTQTASLSGDGRLIVYTRADAPGVWAWRVS